VADLSTLLANMGFSGQSLHPTATVKPFSTAMTFDLSSSLAYEVAQITASFSIAMTNGRDGDELTIALSQSSAGGALITGVTAPGRTVLMRDDLINVNTTPFLVANAVSVLTARFDTINGVPYVVVNIMTGIPIVVAPPIVQQLQSILGGLFVELWDAQLSIGLVGGALDTWTGQRLGTVLSAPTSSNRPAFAIDGTAFGGLPVVQTDFATTKYLAASGLPSLAAAGSFPWATVRYRSRVTGENQAAVFNLDSPTQSLDFSLMTNGTGTNFRRFGMPLSALDGAALDTVVHTVSTWNDGVNRNLKVDGALVTSATAVGCTANMTQVSVGASQTASNKATTSVASILICSAYPGASAAAAAEGAIATRWPA
jgi:hypothetical protein